MFPKLFAFISSIEMPSQALAEAMVPCLITESLPKKTLILTQGQVCNRLYFIEEGFARAFYYKENQEVTSWFMQENEMIISVNSFFNQCPSLESIESLEDIVLTSISFQDLQKLYQNFPEFNRIGRIITERYYCLSEERLMALRLQTTRERYDALIEKYPQIFQRASLKYIASYLGMKPETISRLRSEMRKHYRGNAK